MRLSEIQEQFRKKIEGKVNRNPIYSNYFVLENYGDFDENWETDLPYLSELVQNNTDSNESAVLQYLKSPPVLFGMMHYLEDIISSSERVLIGPALFRTDGLWIWRDDYSYYIETYHIRPRTEFLNYLSAVSENYL
jgi:hypothetical protein